MRVIVVGLGVQGHKRRRFAGSDFVCIRGRAQSRGRLSGCARGFAGRIRRGAALRSRRGEDRTARLSRRTWQARAYRKAAGRGGRGGARAAAAGRARQRRRALYRLQSPLRAAFRAHARSRQIRRAGPDLSLPHVLRQRHGAARAQFRLARSRRRRARRSRLARARYGAVLVRRHRRCVLDRIGRLLREPQPRPRRVRGPTARARSWNSK